MTLTGMSDGMAEFQHGVQGCRTHSEMTTTSKKQDRKTVFTVCRLWTTWRTVFSQSVAGGDSIRVGDDHRVSAQIILIGVGESQSGAEKQTVKHSPLLWKCFISWLIYHFFLISADYKGWIWMDWVSLLMMQLSNITNNINVSRPQFFTFLIFLLKTGNRETWCCSAARQWGLIKAHKALRQKQRLFCCVYCSRTSNCSSCSLHDV